MTTEEQIERISKLLNELDLDDITSAEFDEMFPKQSINDLKDELWLMYCFAEDVWYTINMGDTAEQEPKIECDKCIYSTKNGECQYDDISETIPIEQEPKTEWIPVSERLPEKNVWVLVTVEQNGNRYQEIMRRNKYIEAWTDNIDNYTDEITAWMPLPEPYKESEGMI